MNQSTSTIDQEWPKPDIESVPICPMCESGRRTLLHGNVKDWVFACAPGSWNYWRCDSCESLYLDARPTEASIGRAYDNYYTHCDAQSKKGSLSTGVVRVAIAIKQGFLNYALGTNLPNAIILPIAVYRILKKLELVPRMFLQDIKSSKPGLMLDLGCGDGRLMLVAKKYGWDVVGLEVDDAAVEATRQKGLEVHLGSYKKIADLNQKFDLIVCSHVVEHVHDPRQLISLALASLGEGGQLWLQWPNPKADGLRKYGVYWRGLEAPRHLCLPSTGSIRRVTESIETAAFIVEDNSTFWKWAQISMYEASEKIQKSGSSRTSWLNFFRAALRFIQTGSNISECELCTITIRKSNSHDERHLSTR